MNLKVEKQQKKKKLPFGTFFLELWHIIIP